MQIPYDLYLDRVLGGWIGKSIGGTAGARFEGNKNWIEIDPDQLFPAQVPPNDDLDLQVLWLKVLEAKGPALTSADLADAWLKDCWYPFNEYGTFRRNYRLGIHPPYSGQFDNAFWESGMGCPIRSEIWGYVFPGAPDLAARFARLDGTLDHGPQSVGAEEMLAAMAAMAFWVGDVRRLTEMFWHYLPEGTPIQRLTRAAFECFDQGLPLRDARQRLMALAGHPEACDAQINVPFTFLALLYGKNDLLETLLCALRCGYDTDCTLATSAALIGQILGASRIPAKLKGPIGDALVMGIDYHRPEMTLTALARDTARMGVLMAETCGTGVRITGAPALTPLPATAKVPATRLRVEYCGQPGAAPRVATQVAIHIEGVIAEGSRIEVQGPEGWDIQPARAIVSPTRRSVTVSLRPRETMALFPRRNLFSARLITSAGAPLAQPFGLAGAFLWQFLGVYYDALPPGELPGPFAARKWNHHFVRLDHPYLPEPDVDVAGLYAHWSRVLGRPALLAAAEMRLDLTPLLGLRGPCCVYLARTIVSTTDRACYLAVGNNDAYRIYVNGEAVAEDDQPTWWAPFNGVFPIRLRKGDNHLLVKLLRRGDHLDFSLGIRAGAGSQGTGFNSTDWTVDLADRNPLA